MNLYRLRYQHRQHFRTFLTCLAGLIIAALAIFGAVELFTGYFDTEGRVAKAQADTQKALNYIQGKSAEIEVHGDYAYKYTVQKELVKLEKM